MKFQLVLEMDFDDKDSDNGVWDLMDLVRETRAYGEIVDWDGIPANDKDQVIKVDNPA